MSEGIESDAAANRALRSITRLDVLRQLNLFETVIALYSLEAITPLEKEILDNQHNAELQRKDYLLTKVIPNRGPYKGMKLFQQALKRSDQLEILRVLEQAYEDAVNGIITNESLSLPESLPIASNGCFSFPIARSSQGTNDNESLNSTGATCGSTSDLGEASGSRSDSVSSNAHASDPGSLGRANVEDASRRDERLTSQSSSSPSSSDDDGDTVVPKTLQQQPLPQQQPGMSPSTSGSHIIIHVPISNVGECTTVSVNPMPHRDRSDHISYGSNPYRSHPKHVKQNNIEVTFFSNCTSQEVSSPTAHHNGDANTESVS